MINLVLFNLSLHLAKSINLLTHLSNGITLLPLEVSKDRLLLNVGLLHILAQLGNLGFPLLVELDLGGGGAAGFIQALTQLVNLPGQVRPLPLGLGTSLALSLLLLLNSLLCLGNQVLFIVKLGCKLVVVLLLVGNDDLNVPLVPLKLNHTILSHLKVSLNLPLLLLNGCPRLLLLVKTTLQLSQSRLELGLDGVKVVHLLIDSNHVIIGFGLSFGDVLLFLVQLVDHLILLSNLILQYLDGVIAVSLLKFNLGNGQLNILDFLLDNTDGSTVSLDLSSE